MFIAVNGVRLFFDVEGASLVPDGPSMRDKPTVILLHGGPGADHSIYKPAFSSLADIAQVVYLDHRGNGRSEAGPRESWCLAQWGDDVRAFCDALGICRPIVYGASFGGIVAQAYATRHPGHPGKLILVSAEARGRSHLEEKVALFERLGGPQVGALARRRLIDNQTDDTTLNAWLAQALPLYTRGAANPDVARRWIRKPQVTRWFTRAGGEGQSFDLLEALARIQCPTLVLGGEDDPMVPIACQQDIAAALPAHLVRFERFARCGHGVLPDAPQAFWKVVREFILTPAPTDDQYPDDANPD